MGKYASFEIKSTKKKPIAIVYICNGCVNQVGCRIEAFMKYCANCEDTCPDAEKHIMRQESGVTFSCCIEIEKKHVVVKG